MGQNALRGKAPNRDIFAKPSNIIGYKGGETTKALAYRPNWQVSDGRAEECTGKALNSLTPFLFLSSDCSFHRATLSRVVSVPSSPLLAQQKENNNRTIQFTRRKDNK